MSTQPDLISKNTDQIPDYKVFINAIQINKAPDGFQDELSLQRSGEFKGVFLTYSKVELTFYEGAGFDELKALYDADGVDAIATILYQYLDVTNGTYKDRYVGEFDFSTYKIENGFIVGQIIERGFIEKIINRSSLNVNLLSSESIDGLFITPISQSDLTLPEQFIENEANYTTNDVLGLTEVSQSEDLAYVYFILQSSNIDGAQDSDLTTYRYVDKFVGISSIKQYFRLKGYIEFDADVTSATLTINFLKNDTTVILSIPVTISTVDDITFTFDYEVTNPLAESIANDDTLRCRLDVTHVEKDATDVNLIVIGLDTDSYLNIQQDQDPLSIITRDSFPIYEAFLLTLQRTTGDSNPFKSDFFGRTDTPLTTYASDGELLNIGLGRQIRGSKIDSFPANLDDLFNSMNSIYDIGLGVEQIGGVDKVVVEDIEYFFDKNVILDLSEEIEEKLITLEIITDGYFNSIVTGYNKYDYEENQGLQEYNIKIDFSAPLKVINEQYNNIVPLRADTRGVMKLREKPSHRFPTEDVKGDDELFIFKSRRNVSAFEVETDENFDFIEFSLGTSNSYNMEISPKRNLLRKGRTLRSGLKYKETNYLRFQKADKNSNLTTRLNTELVNLKENDNVLISDLSDPFIKNEFYTVEGIPMGSDRFELLKINTKKLIKLSADKFGWIEKIESNLVEKSATIKLIAADLDYVTPIE